MLVNISDDLIRLRRMGLLDALLLDHSSRRNILWASDAYASLGSAYGRNEEMYALLVAGEHIGLIKTRARKEFEQQTERTRKRAEVFTPFWVVKKMNDYADAVWFGRESGFSRTDSQGRVRFTARRTWRQYVENRRMELTCGEAPFLVTRYDVETGELIPLPERTGLLDRKLRAVDENAESPDEWLEWSYKALRAVYGYEFLGDNLLIARVNVLTTFEEHMEALWHRRPTPEQYKKAIRIITWNLWQMDGLTDRIPILQTDLQQLNIFYIESIPPPHCRIYNWRQRQSIQFRSMKGDRPRMKFDFIIGNPPYHDETLGDNKGFAPPIYHLFLDSSYEIANKVELIHPARFLFNAGSTPKTWNEKMLSDRHLKILLYERDASKVFGNTEIKGGIAVTYHNNEAEYTPINLFIPYSELNTIKEKTLCSENNSLISIIYIQNRFNLDALYQAHPEYRKVIGSNGKDRRFRNNIFDKIPEFREHKLYLDDIIILGVIKNKRAWRYIPSKFIELEHENLKKWKVLVPRVNGSGALGEVLSSPVVAKPDEGYTQTFIGIGAFDDETSANHCLKYIKTKFARVLLGILKITQDNNREVWRYIPLQDFTTASDIDWSKSIPEIDRQLYAKYGLDETEIEFIETHVKEMR